MKFQVPVAAFAEQVTNLKSGPRHVAVPAERQINLKRSLQPVAVLAELATDRDWDGM